MADDLGRAERGRIRRRVVDVAVEHVVAEVVGADVVRTRERRLGRRLGACEHSVDVEALGRAVIGVDDVVPGVQRRRRGGVEEIVVEPGEQPAAVVAAVRLPEDAMGEVEAGERAVPLGARRAVAFQIGPELERERVARRREARHRDRVIHTVERDRSVGITGKHAGLRRASASRDRCRSHRSRCSRRQSRTRRRGASMQLGNRRRRRRGRERRSAAIDRRS